MPIADFTIADQVRSEQAELTTRIATPVSMFRSNGRVIDWASLATAPTTFDGPSDGADILAVLGLSTSTHKRLVNEDGATRLLVRLAYPSTYNTITPVVATQTQGGVGTDEVQTLTIPTTATGGTFTITYDGQTTAAIAYNATAADVQTALLLLSNLDTGDVVVTGGPGATAAYTLTFGGTLAATNVPEITATGSLTGAAVTSPIIQVFGFDSNSLPVRHKTVADATGATLTPAAADVKDGAGTTLYTDYAEFDVAGSRSIIIGIKTKLVAPGITTNAAIQARFAG